MTRSARTSTSGGGRGEASVRTTQDDYLDAARALILDVGWKRTTLTEVARRAGVSRMTIYRSWSDMERLLSDLMTREWGGVVATVADLDDPAAPWVDRLVDGVADTVIALRDNELFVRILELDPEMLLPYLLDRRGRSQDAVITLLATQIAAGQEAGEVRDTDPLLLARTLLLAAHGFALSVHTMADDAISERDLDAEFRLLLRKALLP